MSFFSNDNLNFIRTITEALSRFKTYVADPTSSNLNPSLRIPVLRIGVEHGGPTAYTTVKTLFESTQNPEIREACTAALGRAQSPEHVRDALAFAFSPSVPTQDLHAAPGALARNAKARPALWEWVKENWAMIEKRLGGNVVVFDRFVRLALAEFSAEGIKGDIEGFFEEKETGPFKRALVQVLDSVESNARYRERDEKIVQEWLEANGY